MLHHSAQIMWFMYVRSLLPVYREKGQKDRCLPPIFPLPSSGTRWRLFLLCRYNSKDTAITESDACTTMRLDRPSALALWRKSNSFSWVASPQGKGKGGQIPQTSHLVEIYIMAYLSCTCTLYLCASYGYITYLNKYTQKVIIEP